MSFYYPTFDSSENKHHLPIKMVPVNVRSLYHTAIDVENLTMVTISLFYTINRSTILEEVQKIKIWTEVATRTVTDKVQENVK